MVEVFPVVIPCERLSEHPDGSAFSEGLTISPGIHLTGEATFNLQVTEDRDALAALVARLQIYVTDFKGPTPAEGND